MTQPTIKENVKQMVERLNKLKAERMVEMVGALELKSQIEYGSKFNELSKREKLKLAHLLIEEAS